MADKEDNSAVGALKRKKGNEILFSRADVFHQMLMEDFQFLEAARMHSNFYDPPKLNYEDVTNPEDFHDAALAYPNGLIEFDHFTHRTAERIFKNRLTIEPDIRSLHFLARRSRWPPLGIWAHWFLNTTLFEVIMVITIITNSITIAIDQEIAANDNEEHRNNLETLDFFFLCLFVAEICLKWLDNFGHFWNDGWNIFDAIITATSLVEPTINILFPETEEEEQREGILNAVSYLRIFRIFRALNVVTRIPKIAQIWAAVVKTFTAMIFITALMAIFFYIFAIIGIQAFDRYTHSHIKNLSFRSSFKGLANTFVTLFQLFTLDHWYDLLKETSRAMGGWLIPCVYILAWILLGSFIFRNIFVGVMVNNFQNIRQNMNTQSLKDLRAKRLADQLNIFGLDELEMEHIESDDPLVDWEAEIFHNLEIIRALGEKMSPVMWPRDTMMQYYMLLEAYASNADERDYLFKLMDKALLRFLDS